MHIITPKCYILINVSDLHCLFGKWYTEAVSLYKWEIFSFEFNVGVRIKMETCD